MLWSSVLPAKRWCSCAGSCSSRCRHQARLCSSPPWVPKTRNLWHLDFEFFLGFAAASDESGVGYGIEELQASLPPCVLPESRLVLATKHIPQCSHCWPGAQMRSSRSSPWGFPDPGAKKWLRLEVSGSIATATRDPWEFVLATSTRRFFPCILVVASG